ncbi:hypothetical protein BGZ83_006842 [Gryganskiella cystojenkinii]|nr:hypothetical protein BGZ83_006842 [Gryganskiella cystojenkinii]
MSQGVSNCQLLFRIISSCRCDLCKAWVNQEVTTYTKNKPPTNFDCGCPTCKTWTDREKLQFSKSGAEASGKFGVIQLGSSSPASGFQVHDPRLEFWPGQYRLDNAAVYTAQSVCPSPYRSRFKAQGLPPTFAHVPVKVFVGSISDILIVTSASIFAFTFITPALAIDAIAPAITYHT